MMIFLLSSIVSWFLLLALMPVLRQKLLDQPNSRSSHHAPTPRGGGVVFVVFASISAALMLFYRPDVPVIFVPLLALPLSFIGLFDDRFNLPSALRYVVQLLTACLLLFYSPLVQGFVNVHLFDGLLILSVTALMMVAVTAVINFINFMDGLDGLVAGCMAVAVATISFILNAPWPLWALTGSLLGFLLWNWSPAKVFMGDVGSTFLGAVFSGLVLHAPSWLDAFGFLLLATPLIGDAFFCVIRRLLSGQRVFQAHRLHLYQRLHQAGWSHSRVSLLYITATAVLAVFLLAGDQSFVLVLAVVQLLIGVWLDQRVAVSFAVASQS